MLKAIGTLHMYRSGPEIRGSRWHGGGYRAHELPDLQFW